MGRRKVKKRQKTRIPRLSRPHRVRLTPSLIEEAADVLVDPSDKTIVIAKKNILLNQLKRDGPKIEKSFDHLCMEDLDDLSALTAQVSMMLLSGLRRSHTVEDLLRNMSGQLLINALHSFGAAVQILRSGYRLQPGMIIRNILESVSVVLHLIQKPNDLNQLQSGKLNVPKTINTAKKALPPFGQLYGFFSNKFSHISGFHQAMQPLIEYTERDDALVANLRFLRISAWHLYVTTELLYYDLIVEPRYWKHVTGGLFAYDPTPQERSWMKRFLNGPDGESFLTDRA